MRAGRGVAVAVALIVFLALVACSEGDDPASSPTSRSITTPTTADLPPMIPLDGRPSAVIFAGDALWVADDERDVVARLEPESGAALGEPVPVAPDPIALAPAPGAVWVASAGGVLTPLDVETGAALEPVDVGGVLTDVVVAGDELWVADIERAAIIPVDTATGVVGEPVSVRAGAVRLAMSTGVLWVSGVEDQVTPIDLVTRTVGEPVTVGPGPIGMVVDGDVLWVTTSDADALTPVALGPSAVAEAAVPVGDAPIAVATSGPDLVVLDQDSQTLTHIDRVRRVPVGQPELLGLRPRAFAVSATAVWVVGVEPSGLVRIER